MVQRMAATLKERDCDLSGPLGSSPRLRRVPQIFPLYGPGHTSHPRCSKPVGFRTLGTDAREETDKY